MNLGMLIAVIGAIILFCIYCLLDAGKDKNEDGSMGNSDD